MDRKDFLKKSLVAGVAASVAPSMLKAKNIKVKNSDYDKFMEEIDGL